MPRFDTVAGLMAAVADAKADAAKRFEDLKRKMELAYRTGLFDAAEAYKAEIAALDRLVEIVGKTAIGEGGGLPSSLPVRPPTWKDAVLLALEYGGPMHVRSIWDALQMMGVRPRGRKTSQDPLLMVDDALYRLAAEGKAVRVGRRTWSLRKPEASPKKGDSGGTVQRS